MVDVLKSEYFSKADTFLLPLTGLKKIEPFEVNSYLFWNGNTIQDYKLTVVFHYTDYESFMKYCQNYLFLIWDPKGYLLESYDYENKTIFILDMSEWAMDIEQFLAGKYSKLNQKVKDIIFNYHKINKGVPTHIYAALYPKMKMSVLEGVTPIEYVSKHYEFNENVMFKLGEVGGIYDKFSETLLTDIDSLCQNDSKVGEV